LKHTFPVYTYSNFLIFVEGGFSAMLLIMIGYLNMLYSRILIEILIYVFFFMFVPVIKEAVINC